MNRPYFELLAHSLSVLFSPHTPPLCLTQLRMEYLPYGRRQSVLDALTPRSNGAKGKLRDKWTSAKVRGSG